MGLKIKAPCKGCADMEMGCHGKCDKYKQYREDLEEMKRLKKKDALVKYYLKDKSDQFRRKYERRK